MAPQERKPKPSKKTNGEDTHTKTVQTTRNVRCTLTDAEVLERADRASHIILEIDAKQASIDNAKKQAKADIDALEAEHRAMMGHVRDKAEYRDVPCDAVFDFRDYTVTISRRDTGEVLDRRAMTIAEREEAQERLELEAAADNDADTIEEVIT